MGEHEKLGNNLSEELNIRSNNRVGKEWRTKQLGICAKYYISKY